jgi:hypothetical protein
MCFVCSHPAGIPFAAGMFFPMMEVRLPPEVTLSLFADRPSMPDADRFVLHGFAGAAGCRIGHGDVVGLCHLLVAHAQALQEGRCPRWRLLRCC